MPRCGAGARLAEVSRMRVLWAKSDVLVPLDTGGKLRTWHLLRHIASRHDVTYLGCATPDQSRADIDAMHEVARTVRGVPPRAKPPPAAPAVPGLGRRAPSGRGPLSRRGRGLF